MKILVFSDSHTNISYMQDIITACKADTSLIVHLGDMCSDYKKIKSLFPDIPSVGVKGNNDFFEVDTDSEYICSFEGVKCLFTHGHQYAVKSGITGISVRARALKADLVVFGHTHRPFKEKRGQTMFFNPGTIGHGELITFGIIHIENFSVVSCEVLRYDPFTKEIDFLRNY